MLIARFSQETRCSSCKMQPSLVSHVHLCLCVISMDALILDLQKLLIFSIFCIFVFLWIYYFIAVLICTLEKAMAPHSSTFAWKIPWTEEPGGLQSMGSLRVRYDWATSLSLFTFIYWRRKWQPTPVLLPGESQGQGSLADVGCRLWGRTESDTTEVT